MSAELSFAIAIAPAVSADDLPILTMRLGYLGAGNAYVTGYTTSSGFPTTSGAYDETYNGSRRVFISKFNSSGSYLSDSTFLALLVSPGFGLESQGQQATVREFKIAPSWGKRGHNP